VEEGSRRRGDAGGTFSKQILAGLGDSLTLGLAAQMRKPPLHSATSLSACPLNPIGCIVGDSRQNTTVFSRKS
jgi:hypothetical protein